MHIFSTLSKILFFTTVTTFLPLQSIAQNSNSNSDEQIKIQRINSTVNIDGNSDEAAWKDIKSFQLSAIQPNYGGEPSEHTEILLGYDNDYLYAAGRFYNKDPSDIQVTSFQRDNWHYQTDFIGILLDTFDDNENGVMFMTSPGGTRTDINILNDFINEANTTWNTFWDVATVKNDKGWFSEMRIPFSSLRFQEKNGQVLMGLSVHRWFARKNEVYCYPLTQQKFGYGGVYKPSQTRSILFEGIQSHNPLYITPYLLGGLGQSYILNDAETEYGRTDEFDYEAGLDIKYGLTNNLTLDATINPDFSQVEADDQMINLTRFSLFYPEKRLFFQERSGNFDFSFEGMNSLFYSRRIGIHKSERVRIYGGARIVGRAGPWDIGFLNMQTQKFKDLPSENFNVLRMRRQIINPYSYIGGMVTSRIGNTNSWNTAYGIDGIFRLFGDDYLTLKWAQSFENDKNNQIATLEPSKIFVNWNRRGIKGLGYNLSYSRSGDDFNPGIGFERRNNYTRLGDRIQFGWVPDEQARLQNHAISIEGTTYIRNMDGEIESSRLGTGWRFVTKGNSSGKIGIYHYQEDVQESYPLSEDAEILAGEYKFYGIEGRYLLLQGRPYRIGTNIVAGSFYDGRRFSWSLFPVAYVSAHLQLEGTYQINRIEFPERDQKFTSHVGRLKISTFLDVKHSLIAFIQYNSANDGIITNLRYRFNPSEGHDLYIVYDEGLNTDLEREIPVLPRTNTRTFMLKYSYTFTVGL
ncbi:DUF5916 domain-containing protein [Bacteroidota bacterium]